MTQQNTKDSPQTLLFDADDTLWENNIYFERAIAAFITCLDHKDHSRRMRCAPTSMYVRASPRSLRTATASGSFRRSLGAMF